MLSCDFLHQALLERFESHFRTGDIWKILYIIYFHTSHVVSMSHRGSIYFAYYFDEHSIKLISTILLAVFLTVLKNIRILLSEIYS